MRFSGWANILSASEEMWPSPLQNYRQNRQRQLHPGDCGQWAQAHWNCSWNFHSCKPTPAEGSGEGNSVFLTSMSRGICSAVATVSQDEERTRFGLTRGEGRAPTIQLMVNVDEINLWQINLWQRNEQNAFDRHCGFRFSCISPSL